MKPAPLAMLLAISCCSLIATAQDSVKVRKPKRYANPLVAGQPILKFITLSYESQFRYTITAKEENGLSANNRYRINRVDGIRFNMNKNVLMKPKAYLNLGLTYWHSVFVVDNPGGNSFLQELDDTRFHSIAFTGNFFKPLNEKNFILTNFNIELNGNNRSFGNLAAHNIFAGGGLFYGWKKGMNRMMGIGVLRAYRMGRVIHVPAFLYNKNFTKKWGVDMVLPARLNVRYQPNPRAMVLMGYELDGGQFRMASDRAFVNNNFFQRGEIRPRIGYEQKLSRYFWFSAAAGLRINGNFVVADTYDKEDLVFDNSLRNTLFTTVGLHIVRIDKKKKKK